MALISEFLNLSTSSQDYASVSPTVGFHEWINIYVGEYFYFRGFRYEPRCSLDMANHKSVWEHCTFQGIQLREINGVYVLARVCGGMWIRFFLCGIRLLLIYL